LQWRNALREKKKARLKKRGRGGTKHDIVKGVRAGGRLKERRGSSGFKKRGGGGRPFNGGTILRKKGKGGTMRGTKPRSPYRGGKKGWNKSIDSRAWKKRETRPGSEGTVPG